MFSERKAIDLTHHLSELAKAREVSPLKGLAKYWGKPGIISFAGGMPAPDYFPFHSIGAEILVKDSFPLDTIKSSQSSTSWFWRLFGASDSKKEEKTQAVSVPKYPSEGDPINLATALQYGTATGIVPLLNFLKEFVGKVYQPAYDDYAVLSHTGNTDAWTRCVLTLMNPGDGFIVEEWTYPSALASAQPYGISPIPVTIDGHGLVPSELRKVLAEWDPSAHGGMKRPHVLYTVPVGQNPTGSVLPAERKKAIYDICVEYDVIIVEDDPYYFQQEGEYKPKSMRSSPSKQASPADYIASLNPSFLKFDYQGRVIRLDTFSKTVAPGSRLGWFTCSPLFAERLERQGETTTQAPCGFGQSLVATLLLTWKFEGYVRWLQGVSEQYRTRRDCFIDNLAEEFDLHLSRQHAVGLWEGSSVFVASEKILGSDTDEKRVFGRKQYFSFVPPEAGMFLWLKIQFNDHPAYIAGKETAETLEMKLWTELAEAGILIAPGYMFNGDRVGYDSDAHGEGHFRISFSSASPEEMKKASVIFAKVLKKFFGNA